MELVNILDNWTQRLKIPILGEFGVQESDIEGVVNATGQKNNPVQLEDKDLKDIIKARL